MIAPKAWSPTNQATGSREEREWIEFEVAEAVLVTAVEIFESYNPGAVVAVRARPDAGSEWTALWEGAAAAPEGSGVTDINTGLTSTTARVFRPPIAAPRGTLMRQFRIEMLTVDVAGFNEIDAVKVIGDGADGLPVDSFEPLCAAGATAPGVAAGDCWHACGEADLLSPAFASALQAAAAGAVAWLGQAVEVAALESTGARSTYMVLPMDKGSDPYEPYCGAIRAPAEWFAEGGGVRAAHAVVMLTARPAGGAGSTGRTMAAYEAAIATPCRYSARDIDAGRPLAAHLNVVPLAVAAAAAGGVGSTAARALEDLVLHHLLRSFAFDAALQPTYVAGPSPATPLVRRVDDLPSTLGLSRPAALAAARAHFGCDALEHVELEESGVDGGAYAGVLLEERIYSGEVMTMPRGVPMRRSAVTVGRLQDTGWYRARVDGGAAEVLEYGKARGCAFAQRSCTVWPDEVPAGSDYVCPTVADSSVDSGWAFDSSVSATPPEETLRVGAAQCTADRRSVGRCRFEAFAESLFSGYRHFRQPQESNVGGAALAFVAPDVTFNVGDLGGFCARVEPSEYACADLTRGDEAAYYESYGPSARCFEGERNGAPLVGCFSHACTPDGELRVKVEGSWDVACPPEGGLVSVAAAGISVTCPPALDLCGIYPMLSPALTIVAPAASAVVSTTIDLVLELLNFNASAALGQAVSVRIDGYEHLRWTTPDDGAALTYTIALDALPPGGYDLEVVLVGSDGADQYVERHPLRVDNLITQFASASAGASSEYPGRGAAKALGRPDTDNTAVPTRAVYGNSARAWTPKYADGRSPTNATAGVWLQLAFEQAVYPESLSVYETFGVGALTAVHAIRPDGVLGAEMWVAPASRAVRVSAPVAGEVVLPTVVPLTSPDYAIDTVRLTFAAPSSVQIDAAKLEGYVVRPADLTLGATSPVGFSLRPGERLVRTVGVSSSGSGTTVWAAQVRTKAGGACPWLSLATTDTAGVSKAGESFSLGLAAYIAGEVDSTTAVCDVVVTDRADGGAVLLTFEGALVVDNSPEPEPPAPACVYGTADGGRCRCAPGAYGDLCELRHCPANCSSTVEDPRGACDSASGTCHCAPGYTGLDCAGADAMCYVRMGTDCRPSFTAGTFVLGGADYSNANFGAGLLPESLRCSGSGDGTKGVNAFGCDALAPVTLCCRERTPPPCPFDAAAQDSPCAAEACAGATNASAFTAPGACREAAKRYCFFTPGDAACNAYRPLQAPSDWCPTSLALAQCLALERSALVTSAVVPDECRRVMPRPGACNFAAADEARDPRNAPPSPCGVAECAGEALYSLACRPAVRAHCRARPWDRDARCLAFQGAPRPSHATRHARPCRRPPPPSRRSGARRCKLYHIDTPQREDLPLKRGARGAVAPRKGNKEHFVWRLEGL